MSGSVPVGWHARHVPPPHPIVSADQSDFRVLDHVCLLSGGRIRLLDDDETNPHAKWVGRFDQWSGSRFQSFGINDLEMVDQMFASWNRIASWLRQIDGFQ